MLEDLRRPVVGGDQDIGKRLVVAQQHVEARPQPLDQVGFEQQRLGLGRGGDELDRGGRRDHALDAGVVAGRPRIGDDALPDVLGLADIEHLARGIEHAIDAGRRRRELGVAQQRRAAGRERACARVERERRAPRPRAASAPRRPRRVRLPDRCLCRRRSCRIPIASQWQPPAVRRQRWLRMVNSSDRRRAQIHRSLALRAGHRYRFTNA